MAQNNNTATITVVADTYYKYPINELNAVLRVYGNTDAAIYINRILLPPVEDDTFFYASVEAAEDGKVWCEEHHSFHTPEWVGELRGGCFDTDDNEDAAQFWAEAITNVRKDIDGTNPVTGGEDEAIVRNFDLVEALNHEKDLMVELVGNLDDVDVDGNPTYYWRVTKCDPTDLMFTYYSETGEYCFIGEHVRSYWDIWDETAEFFALDDQGHSMGHTIKYALTKVMWQNICREIEAEPERFYIEYYGKVNNLSADEGYLFRSLDEMPFDICVDGNFIHATGVEYLEVNGEWVVEYENDLDTEYPPVKRAAFIGRA